VTAIGAFVMDAPGVRRVVNNTVKSFAGRETGLWRQGVNRRSAIEGDGWKEEGEEGKSWDGQR
jgi:hypothetical protein